MRYVLFPGHVTSKTDGQTHFISANQLMHLYAIPKGADVIFVIDGCIGYSKEKYKEQPGDVVCIPLYDGNYPILKGVL